MISRLCAVTNTNASEEQLKGNKGYKIFAAKKTFLFLKTS
jgi:hypothetical protein